MSSVSDKDHASAFGWNFDNSYARMPERFYARTRPVPVADPKLVIFNRSLALTLGLQLPEDQAQLAAMFSGNQLPSGADALAQPYAGHQFGFFNILGDGRAHLVGEHVALDGKRYDIQFKGSGRTPFSRGGDGRAALGPMLREYIISEAMHALGISTTRSLAVVTSGETVLREIPLPGAILTRVASSHIRVGSFEFFAARQDQEGLRLLADYAIRRHFPDLRDSGQPYRQLLAAVIERQAALIAQWSGVGFIHGVMNTDNMAISGEAIDYGPCAFMDAYDPATVFSSIDRQGRYAFGNQPQIAQWNLARFAESLLPLLGSDTDEAIAFAEAEIGQFDEIFQRHWLETMRRKLGLCGQEDDDANLIASLLDWMQRNGADYTLTFRELMTESPLGNPSFHNTDFAVWHARWMARRARNVTPLQSSRDLMRVSNPVIIPRNYLVEQALADAALGQLGTMLRLLDALKNPFDDLPGYADLRAKPAPVGTAYRTFCGT